MDAGKKLAKLLKKIADQESVVLAIPRGGVIVGYEISKKLKIPLDIIIVRKLGFPTQPELGIGAIAEKETIFLDKKIINRLGISKNDINEIRENEEKELIRRILAYRKGRSLPNLKNKTVILVDDGLATGVSAIAAIRAIKKAKPKKIVFAVPVASFDSSETIKNEVDYFFSLAFPRDLKAIGLYYDNFEQVSDEEVLSILSKSKKI